MLRGGQASTPRTNGTEDDRPQEPDNKSPDQSTADKRGSKSVAQNVAHFSVSEGLTASLDVTQHNNKKQAEGAQESECASPQSQKRQEITHPVARCHKKKRKRRGGDSNPR